MLSVGVSMASATALMDRRRALNARLGHPEAAFEVIHIAGTNGKGSTAAMLTGALAAAGYRVGRFTSPDLAGPHERVWLDGAHLTPAVHRALAARVAMAAEAVTHDFPGLPAWKPFELRCAEAWLAFAEGGVKLAVVEAGLGGRHDATNVLENKRLTLVSAIGLDHTERLGDTVEAIAREKAGIFRPGVPAVTTATGTAREVLAACAVEVGAPFLVAAPLTAAPTPDGHWVATLAGGPCRLGLAGAFQVENAALVTAGLAASGLDVPANAVRTGLADAVWPGRLETLSDPTGGEWLLDAAHNMPAVKALAAAWGDVDVVVASIQRVKDGPAMLRVLTAGGRPAVLLAWPEGEYWAPAELASSAVGPVHAAESLDEALAVAKRLAPHGRRAVTGSVRLVGEARTALLGE